MAAIVGVDRVDDVLDRRIRNLRETGVATLVAAPHRVTFSDRWSATVSRNCATCAQRAFALVA